MIVELVEVRTGEVVYLAPCLIPTKWINGRYAVLSDRSTVAVARELALNPKMTPEQAAAVFSSYYPGEAWRVKATYDEDDIRA